MSKGSSVSVTWRTRSRLPEISAEVEEKVHEGVEMVREAVAKRAEELAPRLTGELAGSIGVDGEKVVATSPHAIFVERGTVFMSALPFMAPACQYGKELMRAMLAGVRRGL